MQYAQDFDVLVAHAIGNDIGQLAYDQFARSYRASGPPACAAGTLTAMAGGDAAEIERVWPLMADIAGQFTPMAGQALSLYRMLVNLGYAELDTAAVFKLYERAGAS